MSKKRYFEKTDNVPETYKEEEKEPEAKKEPEPEKKYKLIRTVNLSLKKGDSVSKDKYDQMVKGGMAPWFE